MDLRNLKLFLHLSESCHFGRTARAMHVSTSALSRQIQRLEENFGHTLFLRNNRSVILTEAGERLKQFAQHTLLQYQQLCHMMDLNAPYLSGKLRMFCSVTAAYSCLLPIMDRFRVEYPQVEIKLITGNMTDAIEMVQLGNADIAIADRLESLPTSIGFSSLGPISLVLIVPALPCPVRSQATQTAPNWSKIPFIMPDQGPARRVIDLWLRRHRISNPKIYATVSDHEAIVSMVALGCGIALLPDTVLENSPKLLQNRILTLVENVKSVEPLELGIFVQKKRLSEPLIQAFWHLL